MKHRSAKGMRNPSSEAYIPLSYEVFQTSELLVDTFVVQNASVLLQKLRAHFCVLGFGDRIFDVSSF